MWTRAKYCAVCGCPFGLPSFRDLHEVDDNGDEVLFLGDGYDSSVLPTELTHVFPRDILCNEIALIKQAVAYQLSRRWSVAETVGAMFAKNEANSH